MQVALTENGTVAHCEQVVLDYVDKVRLSLGANRCAQKPILCRKKLSRVPRGEGAFGERRVDEPFENPGSKLPTDHAVVTLARTLPPQ